MGTGVWLLTVDALCLFVVRQVPAAAALQAAVRLQPVYIAAALAGAGGALLARGDTASSGGGPRTPDGPESRNGHQAPVALSLVPWPPGGSARPNGMTPTLLGWLVAVGGLIDIASALVPRSVLSFGPLARFAPHVTSPAAHALIVPAGVLLLITARGLIRRNQRAWRLAACCSGFRCCCRYCAVPTTPARS